jgi:hypothetical protein
MTRLCGAFALLFALALVALASGGRPPVARADCPSYDAYPGDSDRTAVARWMGAAMAKGGLPRELPVMGALVESNLKNLPPGGSDYAGFFQIRMSIWNNGEYAGFPDDPPLQVKWFLDRALEARQDRVAAGDTDFGKDPSEYGEWVADVERPAAQYRGRYQPRLAEAQGLLGPVCEEPGSGSVPAPDVTGPALRLGGRRLQRALKARALLVRVRCPAEACAVGATGRLKVPRKRSFELKSPTRQLAAGKTATLKLKLGRRVRVAARRSLERRAVLGARIKVIAADLAGNPTSASRTIFLRR